MVIPQKQWNPRVSHRLPGGGGRKTHHTGEVFFDDEAMYKEKDLASLYRETPEKKERVRRWFAVTDERQTKI